MVIFKGDDEKRVLHFGFVGGRTTMSVDVHGDEAHLDALCKLVGGVITPPGYDVAVCPVNDDADAGAKRSTFMSSPLKGFTSRAQYMSEMGDVP